MNVVKIHDPISDHVHSNYRGRGRKYDHGHTCNKFGPYNCNYQNNNSSAKNDNDHQKWTRNNKKGYMVSKNYENKCYRCGMKDHWARTYCTSKHLVNLYQTSIEKKDKKCRSKLYFSKFDHERYNDYELDNIRIDVTHLDVADFFKHSKGNMDHLIGDGSVQKN